MLSSHGKLKKVVSLLSLFIILVNASVFYFLLGQFWRPHGQIENPPLPHLPSHLVNLTHSSIPLVLHQIAQDSVPNSSFMFYAKSFQERTPGLERIVWTRSMILEFISSSFPGWYPHYKAIKNPQVQNRLASFFILYQFGGIYSDLDTVLLKDMNEWLMEKARVNMIVGILQDSGSLEIELCLFTFASESMNPLLLELAQKALERTQDVSILDLNRLFSQYIFNRVGKVSKSDTDKLVVRNGIALLPRFAFVTRLNGTMPESLLFKFNFENVK